MRNSESLPAFACLLFCWMVAPGSVRAQASAPPSQQPPETLEFTPIDVTPIDGETYYVVNQLSGLQIDLDSNAAPESQVMQQPRSFTSLSQRWFFTRLTGRLWQIGNILSGQCLVSAPAAVRQSPGRGHEGGKAPQDQLLLSPCTEVVTEEWDLTPASNGYYTIANRSTGLLLDLSQGSASAGAALDQTARSGTPSQSQQWLLRPAFFRGVDNALLEKQEAARAAIGLSWWQDAGQPQDVLRILKNHGVNMVRVRPTSAPPYANASQAQCSGNACYAETDAQDLDLAKRAKNLGLSVELTLLFDGGSSSSVPAAWAGDTSITGLQSDIYAYVKAEILAYRQAGTMPDLVSIGNEVDTGFLGALGSPTGEDFQGFATLQIAAMHAVTDAAADTSLGPPIPAPLTCIHITPAWDLTQFFTLANQYSIPYDAICQSYYPIYHGPLTAAQAAASNPGNKPIEQQVLLNAANNIGKPIFNIETGEHYENGFDANDPWYAPPTPALQREFLLDIEGVQKGLPNNLGMGFAYWDPAGVNIPNGSGGFLDGDNLPNAIYIWNGLTIFDNADSSGSTNVNAANYSMLLPGADALGGKLDSTLSYKFVNRGSGQILSVYQGSAAANAMLDTAADSGTPALSQQWRITSNNDGYFQIASLNSGGGGATNVLDDSGGSSASGNLIVQSPSGSSQELEWNVVSAGGGYFNLVNRVSGLVLDMSGGAGPASGFAVQEPLSGNATQQWQIVPVH